MTDPPEVLILPWLAGWLPGDGATELKTEITARVRDARVRVARTETEARDKVQRANVVITNALPPDLLEGAPNLEWLQTVGVGIDHYPLKALRSAGIVVTNAAGVSAEPVAEQVLGYLLVFERRIHRGLRQQYESRWERYSAGELRGKTLGIIGVGSIGGRVAELAQSVGMTVIGSKRHPETGHEHVDELVGSTDVSDLLPRVDYLVISCPLTEETRGLIGEEELVALPSSSVLINIARGEIVDEAALTRAVQNKRIRGAALDVFEKEPLPLDSPLWGLSNVIVTPHMAVSTPKYWARLADIFAQNYEQYTAGEPGSFINEVDLND